MKHHYVISFLFFLLFHEGISAMRILAYFPAVARSHHHVFHPVIQELAKRGHQITYVGPIPLEENSMNVTHIQFPDGAFTEKLLESLGHYPFFLPRSLRTGYIFGQASISFTQAFCTSGKIRELVNSNDSYDVVLHSAFLAQEHALPFIHRFNSLGVGLFPIADVTWVNELSGLTDNPSYMVDFQTYFVDRMNFFERLTSTAHLVSSLVTNYYFLHQVENMVDHCFTYEGWEARPSLYQLAKDQALILTESHHAVGYPYPRAPHVREVGGIHIQTPKLLPESLQNFINDSDSENGFIYYSLGSVLRAESNEFLKLKAVFLRVFSQRKEKVLFKWNTDDDLATPDNVLISKWFPQQDILAHSRVKLFVTHSGFQSTVETVHYGVPILSIPVFSDQYKNARMAVSGGFGLTLNLDNITEEVVTWALNEVLSNPKYRLEAKRRSNLLRDRLVKPLDEAVYWIEYVQKYGRVLQPSSVHLSFIQSHLLDVYAIMGIAIIACISLMQHLKRKIN